jgi:hypothetical protein
MTEVVFLEKDTAKFESTGTNDSIRVALSMKCSEGKISFIQTIEITSGYLKTNVLYNFIS